MYDGPRTLAVVGTYACHQLRMSAVFVSSLSTPAVSCANSSFGCEAMVEDIQTKAWLQVLSRSVVATAVAQEILRLRLPARSMFRCAARSTSVGGVAVPAGTNIVLNIAAVRLFTTCMWSS